MCQTGCGNGISGQLLIVFLCRSLWDSFLRPDVRRNKIVFVNQKSQFWPVQVPFSKAATSLFASKHTECTLNHRCNCWTSTNLSSQATLCNFFQSAVSWYALSRKRGTNTINQKWKSRTHASAVSTSTKPRPNNIKTHTYVPENHPSSPFRVFCGAAEVKCL